MPIVIGDLSGIGQGIQTAGSALARGLEQRAENRLQQQSLDTMLAAMEQQGGDMGALATALKQNRVPPQVALPMAQQAYAASLKPAKPTPFQKKMEEKAAETVFTGLEEGQKVAGQMENVERVEQLAKELTGGLGVGHTLEALAGTERVAELNARGLLMIEPAIKVFNPRGAIPQQKIEMLKDRYAVKASDNRWTIQGKIKAARSMMEKGQEHYQKLLGLVEKYGENIPIKEVLQYEAEGEKLIDAALADQGKADTDGDGDMDNISYKKPPSAAKHKGKTIVNEKGERLISNGKRWVKKG